uniref:Uncharacterized protein n=1 Tax=Arundo donax TaxID=35708 RepID=A0A0A9FDL1_ARUDO
MLPLTCKTCPKGRYFPIFNIENMNILAILYYKQ